MCNGPVGLGAKRTLTGLSDMIIFFAKIRKENVVVLNLFE